MTDTTRPICMWVRRLQKESGAFTEDPDTYVSTHDDACRCTRDAIVEFTNENDTQLYSCPYHAPEELLDALDVPFPEGRNRKDRISV